MKKIIATPGAPAAIGPYSQAVFVGDTLYASGQLPIDPKTGEFPKGGVAEQTEQIFHNIRAILSEAGLGMEDVVKTTVYLKEIGDFGAMNEVYSRQFDGSFPARSAFAVDALPKDALVEIEFVARKG